MPELAEGKISAPMRLFFQASPQAMTGKICSRINTGRSAASSRAFACICARRAIRRSQSDTPWEQTVGLWTAVLSTEPQFSRPRRRQCLEKFQIELLPGLVEGKSPTLI
jgi:hypothetical protein